MFQGSLTTWAALEHIGFYPCVSQRELPELEGGFPELQLLC
jgi:hypothetical protein